MSKTWRCFFCDEVFRTRKEAHEHFGDEGCETDPPACVDPLRTEEKERMSELRKARDYATKTMIENLRLEDRIDFLESQLRYYDGELRKHFGSDATMWVACDSFNNAKYELGLWRSRFPNVRLDEPLPSPPREERA